MSSTEGEKLFSSDGEWNLIPRTDSARQPTPREEKLPSSSSIVSSGTLSDPEKERAWVRGFAQRAAEPDIKQIRAKGPHTYEKKAFQDGQHFYEKERPSSHRLSTDPSRSSPSRHRSMSDSRHASRSPSPRRSREHSRYGQSMLPEPGCSPPRSLGSYRSEDDEDRGDVPMRRSPRRRQSPPRISALPLRRSPSRSPRRSPRRQSSSRPNTGRSSRSRRRHSSPRSHSPSYDSRLSTETYSQEGKDVSMWGREASEKDSMSMSSGLSPRETHPREREFNIYAAQDSLAWAGEKYSKAQVMRREGTAPEAYGVVEDMPTRLAYEQLNVLAGMAGKVQSVIEHNRRIFGRRVLAADKAELSRAFKAWRAARYGTVRTQQLIQRAAARIARGCLARAFLAWKDKFNLVDKYLQMKRKGLSVNRRGRMRRAFMAWRELAQERWWKDQMTMRDNDLDRLSRLCRKYENRPVTILGNRRMRACMREWYNQAWERIRHRQLLAKAANRMLNRQLAQAWETWHGHWEDKKRMDQHLRRTIGRLMNNKKARVWSKWVDVIGAKERKRLRLEKGMRFWRNCALGKAWNSWWEYITERRKLKRVVKHWGNKHMSKAFLRWIEYIDNIHKHRLILKRALNKMRFKTVTLAWEAWHGAMEERKLNEAYGRRDALEEEVQRLRGENERLRRDNERFVRLIDSGEWGRGRVAELVQAGEVMKGERDALMKLIGSLRREYEAVMDAKAAQEAELKDLKHRITNVGGAGRNRLLVKGGSSFNGLVRQMKAEMVEASRSTGMPVDPNRVYEVNKLSMDQVQVFPDGELSVQGVDSVAARSGRFSKPIPVAGGTTRPTSPIQRAHIPPAFQGKYSQSTLQSQYTQGTSPLGMDPSRGSPDRGTRSGRHPVMETLDSRMAHAARRPGMEATQ